MFPDSDILSTLSDSESVKNFKNEGLKMIITDKRVSIETEFHKLVPGQAFTCGDDPDMIYVKIRKRNDCEFNTVKFDVDVAEPVLIFVQDYENVIPISMEIILKHYDYWEKEA